MPGRIVIRWIRTRGLVTFLIAWITGSLFDHVEFGTRGRTWIGAHAVGGVQERPFDYCAPFREYVYELPCTLEQEAAFERHLRTQLGNRYGFLTIVGLLFQLRFLRSPHAAICSQFCGENLNWIFPLRVLNVVDDWWQRVTPETLHLTPLIIGYRTKKIG